jgi:hypothetical protein
MSSRATKRQVISKSNYGQKSFATISIPDFDYNNSKKVINKAKPFTVQYEKLRLIKSMTRCYIISQAT